MRSIREHIAFLYPKQVGQTLEGIQLLVEKYRDIIPVGKFEVSNTDAVLIAYADSFLDVGERPLQTLKRVSEKYLADCVNSIHILPFYPFTSDDGFSVSNYKEVNPDVGSWEDINELGQQFRLMFDAVINHASVSSPWFQAFLRGEKEFANFFVTAKSGHPDLAKVTRPRTLPLLHPFLKEGKEAHVWTTFSADQVDLNFANPQVFLKVLDVLLFYLSQGAKLLRLDAIAFLWKTLGTSCIHLEKTHRVIQAYRGIFEILAPQTLLISETNVPHNENISYFGNGLNEAHAVYNFSLPPLLAYSLHSGDIDTLARWAQTLKVPSDKSFFFNFTASHDGVGVRPLTGIVPDEEIKKLAKVAEDHGGFVSYKTNPNGSASPYELNCSYIDLLTHPSEPNQIRAARFMLTQSVMLAMPGVPGIYYHSLFGSQNDVEAAVKSGINRRINRTKIELSELENSLHDRRTLRSMVFAEYAQLLAIRKKEAAFDPKVHARYKAINGLFIIERQIDNIRLVCIHNFTSEDKNIESYLGGTQNLTHWRITVSMLKPFGFVWLKSKSAKSKIH